MARRDVDRMRREMEQLFADLCQVPRLVAAPPGFRPAVDVYRTESPPAITVVVDLAGVDPGDVELSVGDGLLVVSGARRRERREGRVYQQMEIDHGAFRRRIPLSEPVDAQAAEATYDRGLLTVVLPVAARAKGPVRVPVVGERSS